MSEQYNSLLRLYVEYKYASEQIQRYILDKNYNDIQDIIKRKGEILKHILNQEKIVEYTDDMHLEQAAIKDEIAKIEQENIKLLNVARNEVKSELSRVNKNTNLKRAYSVQDIRKGDIINILE